MHRPWCHKLWGKESIGRPQSEHINQQKSLPKILVLAYEKFYDSVLHNHVIL